MTHEAELAAVTLATRNSRLRADARSRRCGASRPEHEQGTDWHLGTPDGVPGLWDTWSSIEVTARPRDRS